MRPDELPKSARDALAVALDDDAPKAARLRAIATLEQVKAAHRRAVAVSLVDVLGAAPDIAGRAHVALLVLAPDLYLSREDRDGREVFVVVAGRHEGGFGLDELHKLYGPADALPAFLTPPEKPAPAPYRDPRAVREEELSAMVARRRAAHEALLMKMQALGLDADDLDDDLDLDWGDGGRLRRFVPLKGGRPWESFSFVDDRDVVVDNGKDTVALGRLRPGAWWWEETAGDHKGARRFRAAVAVDMAPRFTTRRERAFDVRPPDGKRGTITLSAGGVDLDVHVEARGVVVWVDVDPVGVRRVSSANADVGADGDDDDDDLLFDDEDTDDDLFDDDVKGDLEGGGEIVGITLTWSAWTSFRPDVEKGAPARATPGRKPRL